MQDILTASHTNKLTDSLGKITERISTAPSHADLRAKATPGILEPKELERGKGEEENEEGENVNL